MTVKKSHSLNVNSLIEEDSFLVSIITPSFNCVDFIGETIESVINQTYKNWELIIIDDCSTDESIELIKSYIQKDKRIKLIQFSTNKGASFARSEGIKKAEGDFIAFLDSDDLWLKEKLEKQLRFMLENNYSFTFTAYQHMQENSEILKKIISAPKSVKYSDVLRSCPIGNSSVIYHTKKTGKYFVPNIRKRNDDALWLKMLKNIPKAHGLDEVLMLYRIRKDSLSRNKFELIKYHWHLYRNIENLSVIRSTYHIVYWGVLKVLRIK